MIVTLSKLEVLKNVYDPAEWDLILAKLLGVTLSRQRARLARYERDLRVFEERYHLDSATFSQQFEAGSLGDAMDFFEWMGLYTLRQDLVGKSNYSAEHLPGVAARRSRAGISIIASRMTWICLWMMTYISRCGRRG